MRILQDDGRRVRTQLPRDKNAAPCEEAAAEAKACSAVVVARDIDHLELLFEQKARDRIIEKLDRLDGRHGAVVDVAREDDGLGVHVPREAHELVEDVRLIVRQVAAEEEPPEMPISGMDEAHGESSFPVRATQDGRKANIFTDVRLLLSPVGKEHAKPFRCGRPSQICAKQEERKGRRKT